MTEKSQSKNNIENTREYFRQVKSYNTSIITIGYASFFAVLFYLREHLENNLTKYALICIVISASIFTLYELSNTIRQAHELNKHNREENFFRFWCCFFYPSLFLAVVAVILIIINLVCYF